jgi:hypothetical protein
MSPIQLVVKKLALERGAMRKILFVGHSHIVALRDAHERAGGGTGMAFVWVNRPEFQPEMRGEALNPAIVERITAANADLHVSLFGGNDHSVICVLNDARPFDFVLPEAPGLFADPQREILPAALLKAELKRRVMPHLRELAAYRALARGRMVHIESPPPISSLEFLESHPGEFKVLLAERGFAPALFRYKVWRLHSALYREACAELGIEFLPVPPEMMDEHGMMVPQAWSRDPTYGNAVYGKHVLARFAS